MFIKVQLFVAFLAFASSYASIRNSRAAAGAGGLPIVGGLLSSLGLGRRRREVVAEEKGEPGGGLALGLGLPHLGLLDGVLGKKKKREVIAEESDEPGGGLTLGLGLPHIGLLDGKKKKREVFANGNGGSFAYPLPYVPLLEQPTMPFQIERKRRDTDLTGLLTGIGTVAKAFPVIKVK